MKIRVVSVEKTETKGLSYYATGFGDYKWYMLIEENGEKYQRN